MTAEELIKELQRHPPDMQVKVSNVEDDEYTEIQAVYKTVSYTPGFIILLRKESF